MQMSLEETRQEALGFWINSESRNDQTHGFDRE